jgi:hypothetical protein
VAQYVQTRYQYSWVKVKLKFTIEKAMKAERGSTGIALIFL